jgi:hypothetical protein
MPVYRASPIKRSRRSKAEIARIRDTIYAVLENERPMTVRQVFYQLVTLGVIDKTEAEYKRTVCRLLTRMRTDGVIPYGWISDNTRWMRKPRTYSGLDAALETTARAYRKSLWDEQDAYVEIWCEKDALAGVIYRITEKWDVPLMVTRGYSSLSFLYEAAQAMPTDKPIHLYYLGDFDPSGVDAERSAEERLRKLNCSRHRDADGGKTPHRVRTSGCDSRPDRRIQSPHPTHQEVR